ncbi:MAG: hypothetical protein RLZZ165_1924, partial [Bacteroidota bacterium]
MESTAEDFIEIWGAREHNLKNIDLRIPRDKLVVITGVSGSGKSSIAFDTIHSEGQRRYLESFSAYARQFIGNLTAPDVDKIDGLGPVIAIEQKTTSRNPRSTVGTVTEVYDLFRLFFARTADAYSHVSGKKMVKMTDQEIVKAIEKGYLGKKIILLAPLVKGRKGHYRELFESLSKQGYSKVRVDGKIQQIKKGMLVDRYVIHDIELVIDHVLAGSDPKRLDDSTHLAMTIGEGSMMIQDSETGSVAWFSRNLMDPDSGLSYDEPSPNTFSFNSPYGACPTCTGLAFVYELDMESLVPDESLSINRGAIAPIGEFKSNWMFEQLRIIAKQLDFSLGTPWKKLSRRVKDFILKGSEAVPDNKPLGQGGITFIGIAEFIRDSYQNSQSEKIRTWAEGFMRHAPCPHCGDNRLKMESLC